MPARQCNDRMRVFRLPIGRVFADGILAVRHAGAQATVLDSLAVVVVEYRKGSVLGTGHLAFGYEATKQLGK